MSKKKMKFEDMTDVQPAVIEEKKTVIDETPEGFYEITGLPSKFKLYPEGTKIYSRPLKILEVKQLSTMNDHNFNTVMNSVLSKSMKGIKIEDLVIADKIFIIFWQRANTYKGDGFSVPFTCERCSAPEATYDFDVSNMELEDIKDDYDPNFEFTLPESKAKIKISQMRIVDELLVERYINQHQTEELDEDLLTIAALITSINGADALLKTKYEYLSEELSVRDNLALGKHYKKFEISVKPMLNVTCNKCGGQAETPISFRSEFFLPEYTA